VMIVYSLVIWHIGFGPADRALFAKGAPGG